MEKKRSDPIFYSMEGIFYSMEKIEMIWNDFRIDGPESKSLLDNSMDKLWIFTEAFAHLAKSMENQLEEEFECLSRVME